MSAALNILNVDRIEQLLGKAAAWCLDPRAQKWMRTVARNRLVAGATDTDIVQNFIEWSPGCSPFAPKLEELPEWARTAIDAGRPVHWFDATGFNRRMFWKALPVIAAWFNMFDPKDPTLNRLSRICFESAMSSAFAWRSEIDANIWAYVKDKPKVVINYDNGYRWVELVTALQFEREGNLMDHCVGNGTYYRRSVNKANRYYSLRDPQNQPHVTIEATETDIVQCKGYDNKRPKPEHQSYISQLLTHLKLKIAGDAHMIDHPKAIHA